MLHCSSIVKPLIYSFFHRAPAAFRAMALRRFGVSFFARALPPLSPPSRPSATAAGFFFVFAICN